MDGQELIIWGVVTCIIKMIRNSWNMRTKYFFSSM
jgi:hypothetical protein